MKRAASSSRTRRPTSRGAKPLYEPAAWWSAAHKPILLAAVLPSSRRSSIARLRGGEDGAAVRCTARQRPRSGSVSAAFAAHLAPAPATRSSGHVNCVPSRQIPSRPRAASLAGGKAHTHAERTSRSCAPRQAAMGTDEGSFVPSATYHLKGDGDDLDRFDPDTAARALPQPERRVARVLNGVIGDAWAKIEERHPDVVVSLSGAQQKGRELETAAVATAVARPSSSVTAARWGGGAEGAPVLVVGTAAGQVLLYERVATTGYVQDAESQATLVPFEALDAEERGRAEGEEEEEAEPAGPRRSAR